MSTRDDNLHIETAEVYESSPSVPVQKAFCRVNLQVLHTLLRLPSDVRIIGVSEDGETPNTCRLHLLGNVPEGEVGAIYNYQHTTIITFSGFEKIP